VSLKQLSQTSFTARSADASSGQAGLAMTESTARLRTQVYQVFNFKKKINLQMERANKWRT